MAKELTVVKSWPSADTETPSAPSPVGGTLDLISQYESGDQNVPNYRFGPGYTAQGYYQITNTNWNKIAPLVGIDTSTHPNAMSAPKDAQAKVATYLLTQTPAGIRNWTDYNPRLRAALAAAPAGQGEAARSADTTDIAPAPVAAAAAPGGGMDVLDRLQRGENVDITPEDILRTAFGPTGVQPAPASMAAPQPQAEAPITVVKSWAPPPPTPPQSIGEQLKSQGFLDSAWSAIKGQLSTIKDVFTGEYTHQTAEQIRQFHELEKNGTPEQKREFAKRVIFSNIPFASTVYKATQGNIAGAAGDVVGMAALPVAAKVIPATAGAIKTGLGAAADVARSPVTADVVGVVSPRAANVLRTFRRAANAVESVQEAVAKAKAKAAEAATPAAEATPAAAPAVSKTPGQVYAESQGHDWAALSANDRQLMEQIAQAQANVAAQPAPPEPPVTPPVAPAAPQAAPAAPEAPAATQEPPAAPIVPEAPQAAAPAATVEKWTNWLLDKKITPRTIEGFEEPHWRMFADDAGAPVPGPDEIAQIKQNVAAKEVTTPVQGEQMFREKKAVAEESMTPPKETPPSAAPPVAGVMMEPLPEQIPPHYLEHYAKEGLNVTQRDFAKDLRVADYVLGKKLPDGKVGYTPEEFEALPLEKQNELIREAPTASGKGKHYAYLENPGPGKGRPAAVGIRHIVDTMRWRQAQKAAAKGNP